MDDPYRGDYPKALDLVMEINTIRHDLRRKEERLDQYENALIEFLERRHRKNSAKQSDVPTRDQDAARLTG